MVAESNGSLVDLDAVLLAHSVDVRSLEATRSRVREAGRSYGLDGLKLAQFVLVAHELVVNAIRHGGGTAEVVVWRDAVGLRCAVTDQGRGIPQQYLGPQPAVSEDRIPRWGLRLVRQICPDIRVDTGSHGTHIEAGYPAGATADR
jgi:anti-sigma regulatory factor (Ser/Thr protein kinase)